jgi:hypothetical protein
VLHLHVVAMKEGIVANNMANINVLIKAYAI